MNCPTCAAPLSITGYETEITCSFCGNVMMVPLDMRHNMPVSSYPVQPVQTVPYSYSVGRKSRGAGWLPIIVMLLVFLGIFVVGLQKNGAVLPGLLSAFSSITGIGSPVVGSFGGEGTGAGVFTDPKHIAVDGSDYIYVSDSKTGRIQRFDPTGKYVSYWDVTLVNGIGPQCLAADRTGNVYVCEGSSLIKYNGSSGEQVSRYNGDVFSPLMSASTMLNGGVVACACFGSDDVILKFDAGGNLIDKYTKAISSHEDKPIGFPNLAVDGLGNIFVIDSFNYVVLSYNANGEFQSRFGSEGHGTDQFDLPNAIAVDAQSNVYISDRGVIKVFDKNWHYLRSFGMPSGVYSIWSMTFNTKGFLYVIGYDKKVYKVNVGTGQNQ
jgi:sugar lactone lactonase YvrE